MNPIKLLFKLLQRFVWHEDEAEYARTLEQANDWWAKIQCDEQALKELKGKDLLLAKFKAWSSQWYGKVAFAILFMVAIKWVHEWLNPSADNEETVD
jgi:hypothetical protein